MNCEGTRLSVEAAREEGRDPEGAALEHLGSCEECRAFLGSIEALERGLVADAARAVASVPTSVAERAVAAVRASRTSGRRRRPRALRLVPSLAAVAVVLVGLAVALSAGSGGGGPPTLGPEELRAARELEAARARLLGELEAHGAAASPSSPAAIGREFIGGAYERETEAAAEGMRAVSRAFLGCLPVPRLGLAGDGPGTGARQPPPGAARS